MTKEEKIKEAYGEYWEILSAENKEKALKDNGFVSQYYENRLPEDYERKNFRLRPKSLSGIENNNGWVKIESEHDLPKEVGIFWVNDSRYGGIGQAEWRSGKFITRFNNLYQMEDITHYQPIEKPKPPIY